MGPDILGFDVLNGVEVLDADRLSAIASARRLVVAVVARDAVRHADLSARVALAGHTAVRAEDARGIADVILAITELPALQLTGRGDDPGSTLPTGLSAVQLDAALRAAAAGLRVSLPGEPVSADDAARPALTPREQDVLTCLGEGLSNKAVARRLGISAHTVKFHLEAVFIKLGATSRAEAVAKGLRGGLILL